MTLPAGYHFNIPMADYLADPCEEPALSSGIIEALWKSTPQKAKAMHPRFNPAALDTKPRADIGSAVHALAHGGHPVQYVERVTYRSGKKAGEEFVPTDWKTQDAKDESDAIREAGGIPLLPKDRMGVETAAGAVKMALGMMGPGKHEVTMVFQYRGVWCRSRADWLSDGPVVLPELDLDAPNGVDNDTKTCDEANAVSWVKSTLFSGKLDVQMALRHLGHIELTGKPRKMLWTLAEYQTPFDTDFVGATDELITLGVRKINYACDLWRKCLDTKSWPANKRKVKWASPPAWAEWELENRGVP